MKTLAITGATGFVGKALLAYWSQLGDFQYHVKILSRSPIVKIPDNLSCEVVVGDLLQTNSLISLLENGCTVIHLAYLNTEGRSENIKATRNLIDACKSKKIGRLIHCSTASVMGRSMNQLVTEDSVPVPTTVYGITKLLIEREIVSGASGFFETVILRPTSIYGPRGKNLNKFSEQIIDGSRVSNYLRAFLFARRRLNLVHVDNVCSAIIFLAEVKLVLNGAVFFVSDSDDPRNNYLDVFKILYKQLIGHEYVFPKLLLPPFVLELLLRLLGRDSINPYCDYSSCKLNSIGFERLQGLEAGLINYSNWYLTKSSDVEIGHKLVHR